MRVKNCYVIVLFSVCCLSMCISSSRAFAANWYEYYLDAQKAIEQKDWTTAIENLKQVIKKEPKSEKGKRAYGMRKLDYYPYLLLGKAYLAKGDIENAHFYCEQAKKEGVAPKSEVEECLKTPLSNVPTPKPIESEKMRVAVLDFTSPDEVYRELARAVADTLQTKLIGLGGYTIIVRGENLKKIMEELALQQTGIVDDKTAVQIGKQIGAKFVITGSITKPGSLYTINATLIDVETGAGITAASVEAKEKDEMLKMVPELALKLTSRTVDAK
jgi:TolB-like protein